MLRGQVTSAWDGTLAGEAADEVCLKTRAAVERLLIDMCSIRRAALGDMIKGSSSEFVGFVLAKLRDELAAGELRQLTDLLKSDGAGTTSDDLRRLQSVFGYAFPPDDIVRTGDIVQDAAKDIWLILTPQCHLERFKKKTGGKLTMVRALRITSEGLKSLSEQGTHIDDIGHSSTANHGKAGESVIVLSNVPHKPKDRSALMDVILLAHAWHTVTVKDGPADALRYINELGLERVCTLSESFCAGVVQRLVTTMGSVGVPDFPGFEWKRLRDSLK